MDAAHGGAIFADEVKREWRFHIERYRQPMSLLPEERSKMGKRRKNR
ncbi:MAG: hypothetical protein KDJ54_09070 [Candidatus Competibacteraceae bacterium]|nr:hypothetical protein [Candidatus Competibacteraceae bacterium]